jgi:hypothetical protein
VITTLEPNGKPLKWEPPFLLHGHALFTFHWRAAIRLKFYWWLAMLSEYPVWMVKTGGSGQLLVTKIWVDIILLEWHKNPITEKIIS